MKIRFVTYCHKSEMKIFSHTNWQRCLFNSDVTVCVIYVVFPSGSSYFFCDTVQLTHNNFNIIFNKNGWKT